ncbi:hypothetical protein, partial [Mycobacterium tuberculosis]|uniref:hypothetical protein n=1 Tax=Mycobacterium tuberculosis TaxID=1773 RepID=UPI003F4A004D
MQRIGASLPERGGALRVALGVQPDPPPAGGAGVGVKDRKSAGQGKSVDLGGAGILKKENA